MSTHREETGPFMDSILEKYQQLQLDYAKAQKRIAYLEKRNAKRAPQRKRPPRVSPGGVY
jgi:hypothetical protein